MDNSTPLQQRFWSGLVRSEAERSALEAHLDGVAPGVLRDCGYDAERIKGRPGLWLAVWPFDDEDRPYPEARVYRVDADGVRLLTGPWRGPWARGWALRHAEQRDTANHGLIARTTTTTWSAP